jgi:hypothetical protein
MTREWPVSSLPGALAAAALLGVAVLAPAALAQQPTQVEFATYELFQGPDSVDLRPDSFQRLADAVRKAQTSANCPLGRLKIRAAEGDPLFQQALMAARRDAVLARLQQTGIPVAGRLFVETEMFGGPQGDDTVYEIPGDRTPPTLRTNSDPPKGSKVNPRQRIIVRMAARDDATRWETGVKTIQLVADSEGGRFIASENYEPCSDPKEKRVEATYEVPADPPPIVRLTALAEDHAGLMDQDTAEFPTGDFYGTLTVESANRYLTRADIVLNHDGKGNLTGTMVGQLRHLDVTVGGCTFRMIRPNDFRVSLVGAYTEGRSLKVFINEIQETALTAEARCQGTGGPIGPPGGWKFKMAVWTPQEFLGTPSPLGEGQVLPDGTRQYEVEHPPTRWTVTLRRARN